MEIGIPMESLPEAAYYRWKMGFLWNSYQKLHIIDVNWDSYGILPRSFTLSMEIGIPMESLPEAAHYRWKFRFLWNPMHILCTFLFCHEAARFEK